MSFSCARPMLVRRIPAIGSSYSTGRIFPFETVTANFVPRRCLKNVLIVLPLLTASSAVACGGVSLLGLLLGSWYIQRAVGESRSKWLLTLTCLAAFFSCTFLLRGGIRLRRTRFSLVLFSCGVWSIILTTNLHQGTGYSIRLADFGFSFWMNIGSSVLYFYALMIYLFAGCASQ